MHQLELAPSPRKQQKEKTKWNDNDDDSDGENTKKKGKSFRTGSGKKRSRVVADSDDSDSESDSDSDRKKRKSRVLKTPSKDVNYYNLESGYGAQATRRGQSYLRMACVAFLSILISIWGIGAVLIYAITQNKPCKKDLPLWALTQGLCLTVFANWQLYANATQPPAHLHKAEHALLSASSARAHQRPPLLKSMLMVLLSVLQVGGLVWGSVWTFSMDKDKVCYNGGLGHAWGPPDCASGDGACDYVLYHFCWWSLVLWWAAIIPLLTCLVGSRGLCIGRT